MRLIAFFAVAVVVLPAVALADEVTEVQTGDDESRLKSVFALFSPASTVTVASNMEESILTAPSSVTVFTHAEIVNMGVRSVQELANYVPGFQSFRTVDGGDYVQTQARGTPPGGGLNHVLVIVDGVRINELVAGSFDVLGQELNVDNIKKVEIIRGPGSAIYGANAFFGLINITTLDDINNVRAEVGDNEARTVFANLTLEKAGVHAWGSARVSTDKGSMYTLQDTLGQTGTVRDPGFRGDVSANVAYEGLRLTFRHAQRDYSGPYGGFVSDGVLQNPETHFKVAQSSLRLSYTKVVTPTVNFDVGLSYGTDSYDLETAVPAPGAPLAGALYYGDNYILTGNLHWSVIPTNSISVGFVAQRNNLTNVSTLLDFNPGTFLPLTSPEDFRTSNVQWMQENKPRYLGGVYVQDKWAITDDLNLTAGLRLDAYSDFGEALSPRAALTYRTPWYSYIKAMYGHAFSAPPYEDLYETNAPGIKGNANLKPETVDTLELAYMQNIGDRAEINATFFYERARDLIALGPTATTGVNTFTNAGQFSPYGLEMVAHVQATSDLVFYATLTRIFGEPLNMPDTFASLVINEAIGNFNINLSGILRDASASVPNQGVYGMGNARVAYYFTDEFSAFINVRNATNSRFRTPSALLKSGVYNPPTTFFAGIMAQL